MDPATEQAIYDTVFDVTSRLIAPFFAVLRSNELLYWPFLLSAVLLALAVFVWSQRSVNLAAFRRAYFSKAVWWHPSARADYRFYIVNGILFPLIFGPLLLSSTWVAGQVSAQLSEAFGALPAREAGIGAKVAYTVLFFVLYDFGRYLGHYIQHRSDVLWQFHKVHHSAEVLTPISNARAHPVDLLCMWTLPQAFTGLLHGCFAYAYAASFSPYAYLGLHVAIFAYNIFGNLRHSHVFLSYGPALSRVLLSPAMHQIHHSTEERHFGRNIGYALSIWDALFGTLYIPRGQERFAIGLGDGTDARYRGVWRMYWLPVMDVAARFRTVHRPSKAAE